MLPFVIYDSFGFFPFYFMGKNTGNILLLYTIGKWQLRSPSFFLVVAQVVYAAISVDDFVETVLVLKHDCGWHLLRHTIMLFDRGSLFFRRNLLQRRSFPTLLNIAIRIPPNALADSHGTMFFSQISYFRASFFVPLGHKRSINIR